MLVQGTHYRTVWMKDDGTVKMINQPLLPHKFGITETRDHKKTAEAIQNMTVRGAGAIGATAGFGMAQAFLEAPEKGFGTHIEKAAETLKNTRPTAHNLFYAIDRVLSAAEDHVMIDAKRQSAVSEAQKIAQEDASACKKIGELGNELIHDGFNISTHCNAGWLAFVDWGSALSPIYAAKRSNKNIFVYVDETRPRCQGARLTAWELLNENIPHAVIADNATGHYMKAGKIDMVIVGSDLIAANADFANKIGTYSSAVVARENRIPFYVAAPTSTIDLNTKTGKDIPIEERGQEEVTHMFGRTEKGNQGRVRITPEKAQAKNPAFDVTPAKFVSGIITEKGIIKASESGIRKLFDQKRKNRCLKSFPII